MDAGSGTGCRQKVYNNEMMEKLRQSFFHNQGNMSSSSKQRLKKGLHLVYPKPTLPSSHVTLDGFEIPITQQKSTTAGTGLSNVLACATATGMQLQTVIRALSEFPALHEESNSGGRSVEDSSSGLDAVPELAHIIIELAGQAFAPAHQLCQTVIGLYMTEDFIRTPPRKEPFPTIFGRIKVPSREINEATIQKLKLVFDNSCQEFSNFKFKVTTGRRTSGAIGEEMRRILFLMRHSVQNLHFTAIGCLQLFDLLLFIGMEEQICLHHFFKKLTSMEKSDLLEDISNLRRAVDHIPLLLEKLSWASYTFYRLANNGKSPPTSPLNSDVSIPVFRESLARPYKSSVEMESTNNSIKVKPVLTELLKLQNQKSKTKIKEATGVTKSERFKTTDKKTRTDTKRVSYEDLNNNLEEDDDCNF